MTQLIKTATCKRYPVDSRSTQSGTVKKTIMNVKFDIYNTQKPEQPCSVKQGCDPASGGEVKAPQLVLMDGRSFYVTVDREKWEELYEAGELVFSEQELIRLQAACDQCTAIGKKSLTDGVMLIKETFTGAYIRRGGMKMDHQGYVPE